MMPYGDIDMGQHWLRLHVGTKHLVEPNVGLSSVRSCGIDLRVILQEMLKISILAMRLKITI